MPPAPVRAPHARTDPPPTPTNAPRPPWPRLLLPGRAPRRRVRAPTVEQGCTPYGGSPGGRTAYAGLVALSWRAFQSCPCGYCIYAHRVVASMPPQSRGRRPAARRRPGARPTPSSGLPIALVLAWAFELSPDGVKRTLPAPGTGCSWSGTSERTRSGSTASMARRAACGRRQTGSVCRGRPTSCWHPAADAPRREYAAACP
jgi:hypothetical protein